jgi:hypothetical protein
MPLTARLYSMRLLAGLATVAGIATLGVTHAYNLNKPTGLNGGPAIWNMSRNEAQGLGMPSMDTSMVTLDRRVPANAPLAVVLGSNEWDYPLYGARLGHRLNEFTTVQGASRSDARWLVLGVGFAAPTSAGWRSRPLENGWTLASRVGGRAIAISSEG